MLIFSKNIASDQYNKKNYNSKQAYISKEAKNQDDTMDYCYLSR